MESKTIEILRRKTSETDDSVKAQVRKYILELNTEQSFKVDELLVLTAKNGPIYANVESIRFADSFNLNTFASFKVIYYIYKMNENGPDVEHLELENEESIAGANHWLLPARDLHSVWESLIFEDGVKENVLNFVETTMLFSRQNVDQNIISCNRLVLLHGPPGTGKTTLCKAIAQKISIRMKDQYSYAHLIEINSHSLFSKWFSESGKLVMKLFQKIQDIIDHPTSLVCVLIDEVESIAYSRGEISQNEPTDSLRVVNAVLTQLDKIRKHSNVLILTTSNLTASIDEAFIDRADIVQYIGNPNERAIYEMYTAALNELIKANIITNPNESILPFDILSKQTSFTTTNALSYVLQSIATSSVGLSGRTIKKMPFLAHAMYLRKELASAHDFLQAMRLAIARNKLDKGIIELPNPSKPTKKKKNNKKKGNLENVAENNGILEGKQKIL